MRPRSLRRLNPIGLQELFGLTLPQGRPRTNCYLSPELFTRQARTAMAIAPIAITTAKVVADKTQIIPILPMNAITAIKRKKPAP
jgi:hypothetical protein